MTEFLLFPSQFRVLLTKEATTLRDRLHEVSARLGTVGERNNDFEVARLTARRLKDVQMALVGIAVLERPARVRRSLRRRVRRTQAASCLPGGASAPLTIVSSPGPRASQEA